MPLLKAQLAPPAMKEAIVLDLGDLGAQAAKIRMRAEAEAERIVEAAHAKAEALIAGRLSEADARGHADGLARGLEEGQAQGRAEALAQAQEQLEQLTAAWSAVATQWETQRIAMERDARQAVIGFALQTAEKIVHRVIAVDPATAARQVDEALRLVLSPHDIAVRIHPEDRAAVEEALPQLVAEIGGLGHVTLIEDDTLGRGGCTLTHGSGQVDAQIQTQLDRIAALVLPEAQEAQEAEAGDATATEDQPQVNEPPANTAGTEPITDTPVSPDTLDTSDTDEPTPEPGA